MSTCPAGEFCCEEGNCCPEGQTCCDGDCCAGGAPCCDGVCCGLTRSGEAQVCCNDGSCCDEDCCGESCCASCTECLSDGQGGEVCFPCSECQKCEDDECVPDPEKNCSPCGEGQPPTELCWEGECVAPACSLTLPSRTWCYSPDGTSGIAPFWDLSCSPACDGIVIVPGAEDPPYDEWGISGTGNCASAWGMVIIEVPDGLPAGVYDVPVEYQMNGVVCGGDTLDMTLIRADIAFEGVPEENEEDPGGFLGLNNDDDDNNGVPDLEQHPKVPGEDDLRTVTLTIEDFDPESTVLLRRVYHGSGQVRVFEEAPGGTLVELTEFPIEWGPNQFENPKTLYVEGVAASAAVGDVAMRLRYEALSGPTCIDVVAITVVEAKLDVAKLTNVVVPEPAEAFEGSITKVVVEGLDEDPTLWHVDLPEFSIEPFVTHPAMIITLEKTAPTNNAGVFRVLRDEVVFMNEAVSEIIVPWSSLTSNWSVEAVGAGAADVSLVAKTEGRELHRDTVRVYASLIPPAPGTNRIVSIAGELDAEGFASHRTIGAALNVAGGQDNVIIGRGVYLENTLLVPQGVFVTGLGGAIDPGLPHHLSPINLPIVDGTLTSTVFCLSGYTFNQTRLASLKIVNGKASLGAGVMILDSNGNVDVRFNHITSNIGFPAPGNGGGIGIKQSSVVTIAYNIIEQNSALAAGDGGGGGAGVYVEDPGNVTIQHNLIRVNEAEYGGGIGCRGTQVIGSSGSATIQDNQLHTNTASTAGGAVAVVGKNDDILALTAASPTDGIRGTIGGLPTFVEMNTITGNTTTGVAESRGGGIYNGANLSVMTLTDNDITLNASQGDGSGISTFNAAFTNGSINRIETNGPSGDDGGGIDHGAAGRGSWQNNVIEFNSCVENGGAVHCSVNAQFTSQGNVFRSNSASTGTGGGIYLRNSAFLSNGNNTFSDNTASTNHGGGMAILSQDDNTLSPSPVIQLRAGDNFHDNTAAGHGGAIYMREESTYDKSTLDFNGAVFASNIAGAQTAGRNTSGIYAVHTTAGGALDIRNNTFSDHAGTAMCGLQLRCGSDCNIAENSFGSNQIGLLLISARALIADNEFSDNVPTHIRVDDIAGIAITGNQFNALGTTVFGIWVDTSNYGSALQIHGNNFVGHTAPSSWAITVFDPSIGALGSWDFLDAENNWWNHVNGPDDASPFCIDGDCNTNPGADRADNAMDYTPWSAAPN